MNLPVFAIFAEPHEPALHFAGQAQISPPFGLVAVGMMARITGGRESSQVEPQQSGFWTQTQVNGTYESYGTLGAMADAASVVVVGRFDGVSKGRVFAPEPEFGDRGAAFYLNATFVVDEVLRGSLADPSTKAITVELSSEVREKYQKQQFQPTSRSCS
jgi:hypothetical protein